MNVVRHVRTLWPGWGILSPLPFVAWSIFRLARGELRWDYVALLVCVPLLAFASRAAKKLFVGLYALGLVGLVYDAMRFVKDVGVTAERVHVCDLRAIDARFFGFTDAQGAHLTVHDWFRDHSSTPLDVLCAVPYGTFIFVSIAFAAYLYVADYERMLRFSWNFFLMNVAGFITYHLYPAAPPWYFHAHGCAVDLLARASEGPNLAHVDALLGVGYFAGMYGRASDVFGAMPSLHVAYPLLIVLYGWSRFGIALRALALSFLALMAFAAVYLDHHWIVDLLAGSADALGMFLLVRWATRRRARVRVDRSLRDGVPG